MRKFLAAALVLACSLALAGDFVTNHGSTVPNAKLDAKPCPYLDPNKCNRAVDFNAQSNAALDLRAWVWAPWLPTNAPFCFDGVTCASTFRFDGTNLAASRSVAAPNVIASNVVSAANVISSGPVTATGPVTGNTLNGNSGPSLVTAQGGNTPIALTDWFAFTVKAKAFGVVGNNVVDDTQHLQNAVDYALQHHIHSVEMPSGTIKTTDTIHLGYGTGITTFASIELHGAGRVYNGVATGGTLISPTQVDRPAISVQGVREAVLSDFSLYGANTAWIYAHGLGEGILGGADLDESVPNNWVDPAIQAANPNFDDRYAPYVGIAIDPYSGTAPVHPYPDVTFPSWLGAPGQYSKAYSSIIKFERVEITGFVVGVASQTNADGNGDFWGFEDCRISENKWAISVGNTQAHNVHARKTLLYRNYTHLTNSTHGTLSGHIDGLFDECYVGDSYQIFQLNTAYSGPVTFKACFGELLARIGDVTNSSPPWNPIVFEGTALGLASGFDKVVPTNHVTASQTPITFRDSWLYVSRGFAYSGDVTFERSYIYPGGDGEPVDLASTTYGRRFLNASRRLLPTVLSPGDATPTPADVRVKGWSDDTNGATGVTLSGDPGSDRFLFGNQATSYSRTKTLPWSFTYKRGTDDIGRSLTYMTTMLPITKTSGITWSMDLSSIRTGGVVRDIGVGDALHLMVSGYRFVISAIDGSNVATLEMLNGYKVVAGVMSTDLASIATSGNMVIFNSRVYTLPYPVFADVVAGSNTLTNVGRADGYAAFTSGITAGDWLLSNTAAVGSATTRRPVLWSGDPIGVSSVNAVARTVTLSVVAGTNEISAPFNFWVKP